MKKIYVLIVFTFICISLIGISREHNYTDIEGKFSFYNSSQVSNLYGHEEFEVNRYGTRLVFKLKTEFDPNVVWEDFERKFGDVTADNLIQALNYYDHEMNQYYYDIKKNFILKSGIRLDEEEMYKASSYIYINVEDIYERLIDVDNDFITFASYEEVEKVYSLPLLGGGIIAECPPWETCDPVDGGGGTGGTDPNYSDEFTFENAMIAVNSTTVVPNFSYDGTTRIGIHESLDGTRYDVYPNLNGVFSDNQVVIKNYSPSKVYEEYSSHATIVAGIAAGSNGVAKGSKIYSSYFIGEEQLSDFMEFYSYGIDDLRVDVINMSFGSNVNVLDFGAQFYNELAYNYNTIFIASSGNFVNHIVNAPSAFYNIFSVGGSNNTGTEIWREPNTTYYGSTFNNNDYTDGSSLDKPNIIAPAQIIIEHPHYIVNENGDRVYVSESYHFGTSLSAPIVSGAVALLLEQNELLKVNKECVYALLLATANNYEFLDENQSMNNNIGEKSGAGILQIDKLLEASNNYAVKTFDDNNVKELEFDLDNPYNESVEIAVAIYWLQNNTQQNGEISDFKLTVYYKYVDQFGDVQEELLGVSNSSGNNFELVVDRNILDGIIKVKIERISRSGTAIERVGVAWSVRD